MGQGLSAAQSMKMTVNECPMSGGVIFLVVLIVLAVVGGVAAAVMWKTGKGPFAKDVDSSG